MSPPVGRGGAGQEDASQDERLLFGCLSLLGIAQTSGVPLSKHMFRQSNRPALESVVFHLYALAKGKAQAKKASWATTFIDRFETENALSAVAG